MEAAGEQYGEWWIPNRHQLYSAQVVTQDLYPKMINVIRELAGGAFIMLPSSFKDWTNPVLAPIIRKTQPGFKRRRALGLAVNRGGR
jgi:4-hydroxyphenylacetate 3-monooxygenase